MHRLRLSYDADGRPTTMRYGPDPDPAATRVNTVTYVDDFAIAFEDYPAAAKGQVKTSTDAAGRLDTLTLLPANEQHDYVYDPGTGNLAQIVTPQATLEMSYDGSLPTGEAWSGPGLANASVTKTYDASLRLQSQQIAVGNTSQPAITFTYDNDDLLTQAGDLTLTRDPSNGLVRATSITSGAGTVTDASDYTSFGELQHYVAKYNGTPFFEQTYSRDTLGRITSITETQTIAPAPPATTVKFYKYDAAGRLWRVCPDDACTTITSEYLYDPNGNRLAGSFNQSGTLSAAVYDDQDRLISTQSSILGSQSYTYTANGEEQTKTDASGQTTYTYDALGNLRRVVLPDATQIDYVVDGRNRRIGKKVRINNNTVLARQWLYQDQLEPVAELDGQGNVLAEFIYARKPHVPDYMKKAGQVYRIISDHLGGVRLVVDAADGTIAQQIEYGEFGNVLNVTAPEFQPFAFAGGVHDAETGVVRVGVRDYDAEVGRWTVKDPIGFQGGANVYAYAQEDPIDNLDMSGTFTMTDAALTGSVSGIIAGGLHSVIRPFERIGGGTLSECRDACYEHYFLSDTVTLAGGSLLIGGVSGFGGAWINYMAVINDIPELIPLAQDAYASARMATGGAAFMVSYGTAVALSCQLQCSFGQ